MKNWFRTKADLIADKKRLVAQNALLAAEAEQREKDCIRLGQLANEFLAERNAARKDLGLLRTRERQRIEQCREAARKGAQVTNAKRAALKAVA